MSTQTANPWEEAATSVTRIKTYQIGNSTVTLTAPTRISQVDGAYLPQNKVDAFVGRYKQMGIEIDGRYVQESRLIMLCCGEEGGPTLDQLINIALKNGPLFKRLSLAAMDLCGILDVDVAMAAAEGNTPAGEAD